MNFRPLTYVLQRLIGRKFITAVSEEFDLKLRFKAADGVGRHIYKKDVYEETTTRCLLKEVQFAQGDVVLDVGANIGWYSLLAAKYGSQVYAFEPDPLNFKLLNENIAMNKLEEKVTPYQCALSDKEAVLPLYLYPDKNRGRHSLHAMEGCEKVDVRAVRLDDFLNEQGIEGKHIKFIKMDIEGHEYPALLGATKLLETVPYLLIEHAPDHMERGGYAAEQVLSLLKTYHYVPYQVTKDGSVEISFSQLSQDKTEQNILWKKERN
jgi:FkbM family methyltransferase